MSRNRKRLTDEEWWVQPLPCYWLKLAGSPDEFFDIIDKWMERNCNTWWYRKEGSTNYICGDKSTITALSLWIKCDPFNDDFGECTGDENGR